MAALTQADIEIIVSPSSLVQFCDDDGDGVADATVIASLLEKADATARGILKKGFTDAQIDELFDHDEEILQARCDIAMGLIGRRRQELLQGEGNLGSTYIGWRAEAMKLLERISKADRRATGEAESGTNAHVAAETNESPNRFTFLRSNGRAQRGGF